MAKKPASFSFSSHVAARKAEVREARTRVQILQSHSGVLQLGFKMVEEVAKRAKLLDAFAWPSAHVYTYGDSAELSASFEVPCTSLKDGPLPDVLSKAMLVGFEPTGTDDSVGEFYAERKYRFVKEIGEVKIYLTIRAQVLDAEGATCRKVQTGVKLEEVAQYQLICE